MSSKTTLNQTNPYGAASEDITQQYVANTSGVLKRAETARASMKQHAYQEKRASIADSKETQQAMDSLEYFIKFPKAIYRDDLHSERIGESDYVIVDDETHVPIVVLLGWAGCQDRYLMKYSKIYEDRGLITVRYTAPVDTLFWKRAEMLPIGEKILKLLQDMNFDSHPIIFHIFSNGGAYLYQHISLATVKHKSALEVRGVIFDSAPGERRMLGLYRAVSAIYGREKRKCHCITAIAITITLSIIWFVEETFNAFKCLFFKSLSQPLQASPFNNLKNEENKYPQLFLYSKGDSVIPHKDIEKFMKIRQNQGVDVSSACFDDAEHVKIFIKYPKEYIQYICNFINKCMAMPKYEVAAAPPTGLMSALDIKQRAYMVKYD